LPILQNRRQKILTRLRDMSAKIATNGIQTHACI